MKELWKPTLTNTPPTPYSMYGDKLMPAGENGEGQQPPKTPEGNINPGGNKDVNINQNPQETTGNVNEGEIHQGVPPAPPNEPTKEQGASSSSEESESENNRKNRDIFAGVEDIPAKESELQAKADKNLKTDFDYIDGSIKDESKRQAKKQELRDKKVAELKKLAGFVEKARRSARYHMGNPIDEFEEMSSAIAKGEIDAVSAEPYLARLAQAANELREKEARARYPEQAIMADEISKLTGYEKTRALRSIIYNPDPKKSINPDEPITGALLSEIAGDEEASEMLVDKIIGKPFAAEDADYRLSWYAEINLQSFLTEVRNIPERAAKYERYVNQHEMALRLHEMNRATATKSGDVEGFQNISRTVTPQHLQTGAEIDGVGQIRNLLEIAFGRLYASEVRLNPDSYKPEILLWAREEFRKMAADGVVKSSFKGEDGKFRNLESWEIDRAFAIARNFQSSFYRAPELVSWGNLPKPVELWLQSPFGETVTRVMAGAKWLGKRFRVGRTRGGPEFVTLLFDELNEEYNRKVYGKNYKKGFFGAAKKGINKIGKLDVREDLLPVGLMKTGGFDKGWRPHGAYLGSELMKIDISGLADKFLPPGTDSSKLEEGSTAQMLDAFIKNINKGKRDKANLAEFLANNTEFAYEYHGQKVTIDGVTIPKELTPTDTGKAYRDMEKLLFPLMGLTPVDAAAQARISAENYTFDIKDFNYNLSQDQINFSLGVLISAGSISDNVKTFVWTKVAEILPLRTAYFLAEEGTRDLLKDEKYKSLSGENDKLFNQEFEDKMIRLHFLRMREQKRIIQEEGKNRGLKLKDFFDEAGLNDKEKEFVRKLQDLGKRKAADLAKVPFPHVPFLDDVPFQEANYIKLGSEVFPRRMGSDFRGYSEANSGLIQGMNNLGQKFEELDKHFAEAEEAVGGPEGIDTGQNIVYNFYKTYFKLAKQWTWTKIPGVKTVSNFLNKPTSWLQETFGPNASSWDARETSLRARKLAEVGRIRFKVLPGEKESQMKKLLKETKSAPFNVFLSELVNALVAYILYSSVSFVGKTASEKT